MELSVFTLVHILISLAGILSGLVVLGGWLAGKNYRGLTSFFLATTALTSVTGFCFPFRGFTPAYAVGILSVILLAAAYYALYAGKLAGAWRRVFVINALVALYLNFFVLVAQIFQKTPALKELAPTQSEPSFAIAQTLVLVAFAALGIAAVRNFKAMPPSA
ncbi:MAG TPA: hypothetical protein VIS74_04640 [Chthoniobacterales bacterium]